MLSTVQDSPTGSHRPGGIWGHVLVSVSACVLTVSIVGSAVVLVYKGYQRYELKTKVRNFIDSIENRSPQELAERSAELRDRPKVARYVLPELRRTLAGARSEKQLCAAIEISRGLLNHSSVERALFELRRDGRESVAASATSALANLEPPSRAAEVLGECIKGGATGEVGEAVIDEACAGLFRLGDNGTEVMKKHVDQLSADRRDWLAKYVVSVGGPGCDAWLRMLGKDPASFMKTATTQSPTSAPGASELTAAAQPQTNP